MRVNQPVTHREVPLANTDAIISTTDLNGVVNFVNDDFIRVSGFSEEDMMGQAHNIVRHPDMPQDAFKDLWASLGQQKAWMGLVKNRCKNGDHYYVDAYVTPIHEGGEVVGFQSVRFCPDRATIDRAEVFYKGLRGKKSAIFEKFKPSNISYKIKNWLVGGIYILPVLIWAVYSGNLTFMALALASLLVGGMVGHGMLVSPLVTVSERSKAVFENPIAQYVYSGRRDEVGQLAVVLKNFSLQNKTILGRANYSATELSTVCAETNKIVIQTNDGVSRQQIEVEQMATAMNEMVATVAEVANSAETTSSFAQEVLTKTQEGERKVGGSVQDITELSDVVSRATNVIEQLVIESDNIGSVVEVISNIASQTNLLALNAAIEAARAGEQGRGFAVVADEVRTLASNTQKSTDEIQSTIKAIQHSSSEAMAAMNEGKMRADSSLERAKALGVAFAEISEAVNNISNMSVQVATASEEQSAVAEDINRNVVAISDVANETLDSANQTAVASDQLAVLVDGLQSMVKQFSRR